MSENTKIEWCDHTFNPWEGCQKVGPGCDHCYAETRNARFAGGTAINWGPGAPRRRTSVANWQKPLIWNKQNYWLCEECGVRGSDADLSKTKGEPCHHEMRSSVRQRVFCASLADVFDNQVDPQWRDELADLIETTPNLDWLLLTKRIGNVGPMLVDMFLDGAPDNLILGATIVNQKEADRDISKLLRMAVRRRFLSMEPLLGHVNLRQVPAGVFAASMDALTGMWKWENGPTRRESPAIDWVIVGGESGPCARPMHPAWVRSIRDQCEAAGAPFLFKQWGEYGPVDAEKKPFLPLDEFPKDGLAGTVVTYPNGKQYLFPVKKVGKRAAGRLLDGVEHNGFPQPI